MAETCSDQNGNYGYRTDIEQSPRATSGSGTGRGAETFHEALLVSYDEDDASREPNTMCRIGNEYQAELPTLAGESSRELYVRYMDRDVRTRLPQNFFMPMPVVWITNQRHVSGNVMGTETYPNVDTEPTCCPVKPEEDLERFEGEEARLIPGLLNDCLSNAEKASFLLGLYIFEKNFVEVRQFTEIKGMGAILSYYYGEFYGSKEHRRWSESRKAKSKKCVYGQRIFSGWRRQELLSRMNSRVSEESRNALVEVSKTFGDEKMTLSEYVSSLKRIVGLHVLVEAVGIGTGRRDLTGTALEQSRSSHVMPVRPEVSTIKLWSSLTAAEIVGILNGDHRLSKTRSNDLFWEAVWPRLLARGWHSEQHMGRVASSSRSLVFLVPGVKKFMAELVKGEQYYDSVTDVLRKVAGEPGLIELGDKEAQAEGKRQEPSKFREGQNDLPSRLWHSYLQPSTPSCSVGSVVFTVVDTSLPGGSIRELRTLQTKHASALLPLDCTDFDHNSLEVNSSELATIEAVKVNGSAADNFRKENCNLHVSNQQTDAAIPDIFQISVSNSRGWKDPNDDKHFGKALKRHEQNEGNLEPVYKRRRRSTTDNCSKMKNGSSTSSVAPRLDNKMSCCSIGISEAPENSCQASSFQDKLLHSLGENNRCINAIDLNCAAEPSSENCQTGLLFDLNLPQVCPELDNSDIHSTGLGNQQDRQPIEPEVPSLPKPSDMEAGSQHTAPLRHSTRVRPPTIRVLEAVADGLLDPSPRRRHRGKDGSHNDTARRPLS